MQILLITLGSHGDVHPFIGLALALQKRGHKVSLMTSGYFAPLIRSVGLDFLELGSKEEFDRISDNPDLWHPRKGLAVMSESIGRYLPRMYERISAYIEQHPQAIMIGSTLAWAARLVQEKRGTPLITVHLSPSTLRSVYDMTKIPHVPLGARSPLWMKRTFFALADLLVLDRHFGKGLNAFRKTIGLPPARKIVAEWWHSPLKVIGLWPDFFAPPQIDWPPNTVLAGFPLWDETDVTPLSREIEEFLSAGPPPIAFTPGSAMKHGNDFFRHAARACELTTMRGILLTRHRDQIPSHLPSSVAHFDYAPFSQLLPRCAMLVHHGGIGTTAQALAAGVRQIVVPFSFDQFDNAERSTRLQCALSLPQKKFTPSELAQTIRRAQAQLDTGNLVDIADRIRANRGIEKACDQIEQLSGPAYA
ncbi:MAG TPA: glycosyltransferase [Tepidisphaeraceae bacterium]